MLHFFRKHEKKFFLFITIIIVISFTFFGTYSALQTDEMEDPVVFKSLTNRQVKKSEVELLTYFLLTYQDDFHLYFGAFGPNFLNDGVFQRDFLDTGLLALLAKNYASDLDSELKGRFEREKRYRPYQHPAAPFISQQALYEQRAKPLAKTLKEYQELEEPLSKESLELKILLYLQEKQFPSTFTKAYLLRQQEQAGFVPKDPNLIQGTLTLFDYITIEDWFGPKLLRLASSFIINASHIAEQRGYRVTDEEVYLSLLENAKNSFNARKGAENLFANTATEYLNAQLTRMRLTKAQAIAIWKHVLLFRRLFQDAANLTLIDDLSLEPFNKHMSKELDLSVFKLPSVFTIRTLEDFAHVQTYLEAISENSNDLASLPKLRSLDKIKARNKELLKNSYTVKVKRVSLEDLQARISLREMYAWQAQEKNFALLQKEFKDKLLGAPKTEKERLTLLNALDPMKRAQIDRYSRQQIVAERKDRIPLELSSANEETLTLTVSLANDEIPLKGVNKPSKLIEALEEAPLNDPNFAKLNPYIDSDEAAFAITVLERSQEPSLMSFEEAMSLGTLPKLVKKQLENTYAKVKEKDPDAYKNKQGSFKEFSEVKDLLIQERFQTTLTKLQKEAKKNKPPFAYRFVPLLKKAVEIQHQDDRSFRELYVKQQGASDPLFLLEERHTYTLRDKDELVDVEEIFKQPAQKAVLNYGENQPPVIYLINEKREGNVFSNLFLKVHAVKRALSLEAKRDLGKELIQETKGHLTLTETNE